MMRRRSLALATLLVIACTQDERPLTQLVLVSDTDLPGVDAVQFSVQSDDGSRIETATVPRPGEGPAYVSVVRDDGPLGPLTVTATAVRAEAALPALQRVQRVWFVPDQTRVVPLHLTQRCIGVRCAEGETCDEGGCTPIELATDVLPAWDGTPPGLGERMDAGTVVVDAGTAYEDASAADAGGDPGTDASQSAPAVRDAGGSDAGGSDAGGSDAGGSDAGGSSATGADAAVDAGPRDDGRTRCDDGTFDLQTDPFHCGSCTTRCPDGTGRHTIQSCKDGVCQPRALVCQPMWGDCDRWPLISCETSLVDDDHCGGCDVECDDDTECTATGTCAPK